MNKFIVTLSVSVLITLSGCHTGDSKADGSRKGEEVSTSPVSGDIVLTREQFETAGMKIGAPNTAHFSQSIETNGFIEAANRGTAEISTLLSGRVRQIYHFIGDYVKKGEILFSLESNEIILLQQTYAETYQELRLLQSDFERLKSLSEENIVARKDYLKAESDLKISQAKAEGLKRMLTMIQIDPSQVEKGEIIPFQSVISPISGFITRQELVLGQYIELNETPIEIIDPDKFRLSLQVFESSIGEVAIGQAVLFSTPDRPGIKFKATISQLGKTVSAESRSVQCYATIHPEETSFFLDNMFVEAEILTCEREVLALPETALIREPDRDYVLVLLEQNDQSYTFRKMPVQTGMTRNGFTEILDEDLSSVLVEGAFSLWTEE